MIVLHSLYYGLPFNYFNRDLLYFLKGCGAVCRDIVELCLAISILDFTLYALLRKRPIILISIKFFLITVNICMFAADVFTVYYYKSPVSIAILEAIFSTNFREGSEFLQMYLSSPELWLLYAAVIAAIILLRCFFTVICRKKRLLLILLLIGSLAGTASEIRDFKQHGTRGLRFKDAAAVSRLSFMFFKWYQENSDWQKLLQEASTSVRLSSNKSSIPYVVFILGESTGKKHMSIYGYHLPTTPNLEQLQAEEKLYVFDDVICPNGFTHLVVQKLFTFYRIGYSGRWQDYTSLFNILKEAGYYTVWLSNQERILWGGVTHLCSEQCSVNMFVEKFRDDFKKVMPYDEQLLPLIDESLKAGHAKNFYMIHLLGTHASYSERYPAECSKIAPEQEEGSSDFMRKIRAHYDNAVLYNDFVLNEIISRFKDKNAIVIYISDHGEDVFDGGPILGHGENAYDRYVMEIPMIIWLSQKFSDTYPELESRIAASIHRPYMTDDIIHTVLDIMSIETDDYDPSRSVINPKFNALRPRTHAGRFLYDK